MAVENTFKVNFDSHLILLYKQNHESQYKGIFSDGHMCKKGIFSDGHMCKKGIFFDILQKNRKIIVNKLFSPCFFHLISSSKKYQSLTILWGLKELLLI